MKVVVVTPEEFMGDVIGDLNSKRGCIESMEDLSSGVKEITAFVKLGNVWFYHQSAFYDGGSRQLQHGTRPLRRCSRQRGSRSLLRTANNCLTR